MQTYKEFQEEIFDWFIGKHQSDPMFSFSLRMKANKGSESNYFIGTEKSKYFGTTFWNIPIGFPGSSTDLIDLFFKLEGTGYSYYIQFYQTRNPDNEQNKFALEFIQQVKPVIKKNSKISMKISRMGKWNIISFAPVLFILQLKH